MTLAKRIIPCLDVKDGRVVKGVRFREHRDIGDACDLGQRYSGDGADELVFYDITASAESRQVSLSWVEAIAKIINIPFCVAGGIRSLTGAREILNRGADKVSLNSPALENPGLISELAAEFGSQSVIIGIDSFYDGQDFIVYQYTGSEEKTRATAKKTLAWAQEVQNLGAGEIVVNCMNQDGVRKGYDIAQIATISDTLSIPVVASGGAGSMDDFLALFQKTQATGALAASVFHDGIIQIPDLKTFLIQEGIPIRPPKNI